MARIRTIKPEFFTSADIVGLTPLARLFFVSLWCEADREGRLEWKPRTLKLRYFPGDDCDIEAMGQELVDGGLVVLYEVDGMQFAEIPGFKKHQVINNRESQSQIPQRDCDASVTRESGVLGEGKGRERKGSIKDPLTPLAGGESQEPEKPKLERKQRVQLKTFIELCKTSGEKPISGYKPLLEYVEVTGLPMEFVQLAWEVFKAEFMPGGANEKRQQADWRRHFLNYVQRGYYRLWYAKQSGEDTLYELSTQGIQAQALYREVA